MNTYFLFLIHWPFTCPVICALTKNLRGRGRRYKMAG